MKKAKNKKNNSNAKTKKTVFSKKRASRLLGLLMQIIAKETIN